MTLSNACGLYTAAVAAACRFLLGIAFVFAWSTGSASAAADLVVRDSPADLSLLGCLQPTGDALPRLVYPPDALRLKRESTVRVSLTFRRADAAPDVKVLLSTGGDEFADAVVERVRVYRLPCLKPDDGPRTVTQEFYFDSRDGRPVVWNPPRVDRSGEPPIKCGELAPVDFAYPTAALKQDSTSSRIELRPQSGVVLALLDIRSETEAPGATILFDAGSRLLTETVQEALKRTRIRCDRYPAQVSRAFAFIIKGEPEYALKDMSLRTFVGMVQGLEQQRVRFDFDTMRCPFDVQLKLYQPYLPNVVGEVGEADPNRADFLDWLRLVRLELPKSAAKHLIGTATRVSVACGALDLRN